MSSTGRETCARACLRIGHQAPYAKPFIIVGHKLREANKRDFNDERAQAVVVFEKMSRVLYC
jgi:hypothetical protein